MEIVIDAGSPTHPYEQLRERMIEQIAAGSLIAGTKLPTVRGLAERLGLAANTVARAYRELERDGFIETRGRAGSFVSARADVAEQQAQLAAQVFASRVRQLGVAEARALEFARTAFASSEEQGGR